MAATGLHREFQPASGVQALARAVLEPIYRAKFSKYMPLVFILLSMVWTIYRTRHYLGSAFALQPLVAWPTALAIELLVLAASAGVFITLRASYVAELKDEDARRAQVGVVLSMVSLAIAFIALLGVAATDAWLMTREYIPAALMTLIQAAQALFIVLFISQADLEERENLRAQYAAYRSGTCRHCNQPVTPNNRARHEASCVMRPNETHNS
jgi:hypothetical protein